jgi:hypothetical protein
MVLVIFPAMVGKIETWFTARISPLITTLFSIVLFTTGVTRTVVALRAPWPLGLCGPSCPEGACPEGGDADGGA